VTLYDLVFLALFVATIALLATAGVQALRRRTQRALATLRGLAVGAVAYFGVIVIVSLATPQHVGRLNDPRCSDDWCIAATGIQRRSASAGDTYEVAIRLWSRAGRVAQREQGVVAYLRDADGRRYESAPQPGDVPFDVRLEPGQMLMTSRTFTVPAGARDLGLVISHEGMPFPGCCIIADENSLFHTKTIVPLASAAPPAVNAGGGRGSGRGAP